MNDLGNVRRALRCFSLRGQSKCLFLDGLQEAFDQAVEGSTKIVTLSASSTNIHRGLEKILARAGIVPWDDLLQTLRSCAETDFVKLNPQHAVSKWIGIRWRSPNDTTCKSTMKLQVDNEVLDAGSTSDGVSRLRAAQSAAVGSDTASQVEVTHGNGQANSNTIIAPAKQKTAVNTGA